MLAFLGQLKIALQLLGPPREHVFKPAESALTAYRDLQTVDDCRIVHRLDEQLHIRVAWARAFALHVDPTALILVILVKPETISSTSGQSVAPVDNQ